MKKKLLGGFLAVAILLAAGIVAARAGTAEARIASNTLAGGSVSAQQADAGGKPYIGISITSTEDGSDGALIVRVMEGSAADGNLRRNDIITAINGNATEGPRDVVRMVREHSPGDGIVFSILRDGANMPVAITIGEREAAEREDGRLRHRFKLSGEAAGQLVLSDTRYMTDDGVITVRKAVGTAQNINASAGTFDLLLGDDSETLSFTIDDDTKIAIDTAGDEADLSDLSADTTAMVVQVTHPDGTSKVQSVAQGEFSLMMHSIFGRHGFDMMPRIGQGESDGFSPRRFFRWRGGNDEYSGHRGKGYD